MTKFKTLALAAALAAAFAALPAHASLLGSNVTFQYYSYGGPYNDGGSPTSFTADGAAHAQFFNYFNITVTANQIIYDYNGDSSTWSPSVVSLNSGGLYIENGSLLTFAGAPNITGVSVDGSSNMGGFGAGSVTFNGANVAVNWTNLSFDADTQVVLNVTTVPEPSTYALMALGLAGIAAVSRRRRQD